MTDLVFLGINDLGERVYDFLTGRDDVQVLALLTERDQLDVVERLCPDLLVSAGFRHIVPESVLEVPELGAVNLHNSYLPYNRGANADVWAILNDDPAGVSIHYMTAEVDGGPVIDRREVPIRPEDTARDLYERLEDAQYEQFVDCWPAIRDGSADVVDIDRSAGTYHEKRDFVDLWELDLDERVRVGDLLDRLRALTFPPHWNAYFESGGRQYYVRVAIRPADEVDDEPGDKGSPEEYITLLDTAD